MNKISDKKVAIYIDGSNLYYKLKELGIENTIEFNYSKFCDYLARGRKVISKRYYVGVVRAKMDNIKGQELRKEQQKLFNNLRKQDFIIKRGYLMENNVRYHEKGVDVKLAIDLLIGAYDNIYDVAIVVSSDTDLIPAIKQIKYLNKEIEYIGFSHRPSFGMQKYATKSILLLKEDIEKFIQTSLV